MSSEKKPKPGRPPKGYSPATLGGFIKKARIKKGWSLAKLAEEAGIARAYVQKIEGNESQVSFVVIIRVARVLKLDLYQLARRAEQ